MLHETSARAIRAILRECRRLLRPGGVMAHGESRQYFAKEPFDAQWHAWGAHYNAEPFMQQMHETEMKALAVECGFAPAKSFPQVPLLSTLGPDLVITDNGPPPANYPQSLYISGAVKEADTRRVFLRHAASLELGRPVPPAAVETPL